MLRDPPFEDNQHTNYRTETRLSVHTANPPSTVSASIPRVINPRFTQRTRFLRKFQPPTLCVGGPCHNSIKATLTHERQCLPR